MQIIGIKFHFLIAFHIISYTCVYVLVYSKHDVFLYLLKLKKLFKTKKIILNFFKNTIKLQYHTPS